jgi:23S rRNA (uracil1939-C5)-methyltransferase
MQPSADREAPLCQVFSECGGCQLQHLSYKAQLAWKTERVRAVLTRLGKVAQPRILPIVSAERPWDYRNKAQFPVGRINGEIKLGFYEHGSHRLVPADSCLVQHARIREAAAVITRHLNLLKIAPFDESTGTGYIRHILCRISFSTEKLLITIVATRRCVALDELVSAMEQEIPGLAGVTLNINSKPGNRILSDNNMVLWGEGYLVETLQVGDLRAVFHVSAPSFFQVNPIQAQELFAAVLRYAAVDKTSTVLDAYCGTGSITLFLALAGAHRVWGIEEVPAAVKDAVTNARVNNIENTSFVYGRVEDVATELVGEAGPLDVLVVDPPRAGLEHSFIQAAAKWRPKRWVYVSCNPATLARDIALLDTEGYRLQEAQPVDMFPHTAHIECVALLLPK